MKNSEKPSFPTLTYNEVSGQPNGHLLGLTKREYFVGIALQSMSGVIEDKLKHTTIHRLVIDYGRSYDETVKHTKKNIAKMAVELADLILEELEKPKKL